MKKYIDIGIYIYYQYYIIIVPINYIIYITKKYYKCWSNFNLLCKHRSNECDSLSLNFYGVG